MKCFIVLLSLLGSFSAKALPLFSEVKYALRDAQVKQQLKAQNVTVIGVSETVYDKMPKASCYQLKLISAVASTRSADTQRKKMIVCVTMVYDKTTGGQKPKTRATEIY